MLLQMHRTATRKPSWAWQAITGWTRASLSGLAYDLEKISRWCSDYAISVNCLVSPSSTEKKVGIKYKVKVSNDVSLNAGYSQANRTSTFDHNAVTPLGGLEY